MVLKFLSWKETVDRLPHESHVHFAAAVGEDALDYLHRKPLDPEGIDHQERRGKLRSRLLKTVKGFGHPAIERIFDHMHPRGSGQPRAPLFHEMLKALNPVWLFLNENEHNFRVYHMLGIVIG